MLSSYHKLSFIGRAEYTVTVRSRYRWLSGPLIDNWFHMGCKLIVRYLLLCCLVFVVLLFWSRPSFIQISLNNGDSGLSRSQRESSFDAASKRHEGDGLVMLGIVRNQEDRAVREEGYNQHAFNLLISNRLGFHRKIPDTRFPL